jgi:hypothetical protein
MPKQKIYKISKKKPILFSNIKSPKVKFEHQADDRYQYLRFEGGTEVASGKKAALPSPLILFSLHLRNELSI